MTKEAIEMLEPLCKRIVELKVQKAQVEKELKEAEATVKDRMNKENTISTVIGGYTANLIKVADGLTVDTEKLKADGLYDKYTKPKAGYETLKIAVI